MEGKVNLPEAGDADSAESHENNLENSKSKFAQNKRLDLNDLLERMKVKKSQDLRTNITLLSAVSIILIIVGITVLIFL
ncbi:hypothetical protein OAJ64_00080 [Pelagibacteraceae bacterium]|nr:hypothetical protein [Pelagibacteraceae bacterium]